jgi:hypothetical protein
MKLYRKKDLLLEIFTVENSTKMFLKLLENLER